ncbi:uncharacterized protein LOC120256373 [Dioscorea cayenensis subsp. rotundata]|uniref:Uncharacterized protein LOC120256373 n=1 Tax=Dioscorea cayennensis subsp. rotundata TaxID=55577 RepID=A0AB40AYD3_DIOCR|nr:uncharacterized protein LOC120256373 [Dioscorea cayenensis subsp. rotundata]
MTAMFLNIIAHHVKNRIIKFDFVRSGETVSRHFHAVLKSVILCHGVLLKKPEPVPENSIDFRWKWFKCCLGALDGTHIRINVPKVDRPRYRSRKSEITTNILGVYDQDMQFTYVLSGWEGSAHDGRVLRNAITKPNGLRVPNGFYYLVDAGYANCPGFLAPFRGQRYHLSVWADGHQPRTPQEFFKYETCKCEKCDREGIWEMAEDLAEDEIDNLNLEEQEEDDMENITAVVPTDE